MTPLHDLLHWLVDRVEAHPGEREAAHQLADQAHPEDDTPDVPEAAAERGPEPGEGGSQP